MLLGRKRIRDRRFAGAAHLGKAPLFEFSRQASNNGFIPRRLGNDNNL
jgi:hypothetical protein